MAKYVFPLDPGMVEYVFAPLFDYEHAPAIAIKIDPSSTAVVSRETEWCYTKIVWHGAHMDEVAVMAHCLAPFDAFNHDTLIAAFTLAPRATIEFALLDGDGKILGNWSEPLFGTGVRQEVLFKINHLLANIGSPRALGRLFRLRSRSFGGVAIRVSSTVADAGVLALTWLGLRDSKAYAMLQRSRRGFVPDWSPWILDRPLWGEFAPSHGVLFGKEELLHLRIKKELPGWKENFALLEKKAQQFLKHDPENDLGQYLPHHDARFKRVSNNPSTAWHWEAVVLAFVGLVNQDDRMISQALRYLMCMIHTPHWVDGSENRIPSSTWNWRSFMEEMTTTSVAILLDWIGFALTPQAINLARQALWTRGMARVQRDLFQFDYMHTMNQGAVFCRALIFGGLTLEREWPRAKYLVDDAYQTMTTVLADYIKPDGGISEGPGYLCQTLTATLWATIAYSRARNLDWRDEAKRLFGTVEPYVRVMAGGSPGQCIPSGDCRIEWFSGDGIPILAAIYTDSAYSNILMECLRNGWVHELTGTLAGSGGMVGMVYGPDAVPPSRDLVEHSLWLPDTGKFACTREIKGHRVRVWATATSFGASHSHLDHGAIGIEIDRNPVFIDRGMAEYWHAELVHLMKRSFAHNVLTPVLADGSWADQVMVTEPFTSTTKTGAWPILLQIPGEEVWPNQMRNYERAIEECDTAPAAFRVRDRGELCGPGRVAFHLHSPHQFVVDGTTVVAQISGVRCVVDFAWASEVKVSKSIPDFAGRDIYHICAVSRASTNFDLSTTIAIDPLDSKPDFQRDISV